MKATQMLHNLGQSIWLDNITRELLDSGTLEHYITDLSVTASDVLYIGALAAPNTVNTMPEETLLAFGEHGRTNGVIPRRVADCEQVLTEFGRVGIDVATLGADLQAEGAKPFDDSWQDLLNAIEAKRQAVLDGSTPTGALPAFDPRPTEALRRKLGGKKIDLASTRGLVTPRTQSFTRCT